MKKYEVEKILNLDGKGEWAVVKLEEQKDGEMTEDELKQAEKQIQELTDKSIEEVDKVLSNKENEILSI